MKAKTQAPVISVMVAVPELPAAVEWYVRAPGVTVLWSLGSEIRKVQIGVLRD